MATLRPLTGGTAYSLSDLLNRLDDNPDDEFALREFDEVFGDVQQDVGYRYTSSSLQTRQNRHLARFIQTMRLKNFRDPNFRDLSDEQVVDREIKRASKEQVIENVRLYLRAETRWIKPRSIADERPRYQSLLQCRESMLFWVTREMGENAPQRWRLINASNETLQRIGRQLGLNRTRKIKTYFGRLELSQLIDWDTLRSPFLPVTESHHLAWCLGSVCGVRPGSIGWTKHHKDQFLSFGDIELTRAGKAMFNAKITFRYLKGNRDTLATETGLTFFVNGATISAHLPMSIPHRLLVMLLRRKGLAAHTTLESLLSGDERTIVIKDEFKNLPVCRGGGPRGLSISEEALGANSMTEYVGLHAREAGYPPNISMYSWRRKAGTEWMRATSESTAKTLMGHDPNSDALRRYYDQGLFDVPVFEIAMRADTNIAAATMDEDSPEVLMRMVDNRRVKGAFLERRADEICQESTEYQAAEANNDARAIFNIRRRAKKLAARLLHEEEKKLQDSNLTAEEFERRKTQVAEPTELVQLIRQRAKDILASSSLLDPVDDVNSARQSDPQQVQFEQGESSAGPSGAPPGRGISHGASLFVPENEGKSATEDGDFEKGIQDRDLNDEDLIDAEDDFGHTNANDSGIRVHVDAENTYNDVEQEGESPEQFEFATEIFMTCLGQETFVVGGAEALRCDLCRNAEYRADNEKNRIWPSRAKLQAHQMGREHSKQGEVMKRLHARAAAAEDHKYHCPYGACRMKYSNINKLIEHIKESGPPTIDPGATADAEQRQSQQHDDDKRVDGWYDDDFFFNVLERKPGLVRENRRRTLGLHYSDMEELPEPVRAVVDVSYEVVFGDHDGATITQGQQQFQGVLLHGDVPDNPMQNHPFEAATDRAIVHSESNEMVASHPFEPVPEQYQGVLLRGDQLGPEYKHPAKYRRLG